MTGAGAKTRNAVWSGVLGARVRLFFHSDCWRFYFTRRRFEIGHRWVGHLLIGDSIWSGRRFAIECGWGRRWVVPPGEIIWRRHWYWAPDFPGLVHHRGRIVGIHAMQRVWILRP